ncbi:MAG: hypothetical protein WCA78_14440 [Rhizomicrobium sp.]
MTTLEAALIKEQGVTFAVVSVRDSVIDNSNEAQRMAHAMSLRFRCPTVLIGAQRHRLYGRRDLVAFLSHVHISQLPWKRWDVAA